MPSGVRSREARVSIPGDSAPAVQGPWRSALEQVDPATILAADARRILVAALVAAAAPPPPRWVARGFLREVATVRRHLAPIADPAVLAASFGREAFRGARVEPGHAVEASAVRVAYAIRWIELGIDLRLPAWELWFDPSPPCRRGG